MKKSKVTKKFLAGGVIFLHLFTQTMPVSFADGETLPPVINLQEGTATAFGDIVIPEGQRLAVNIIDALGQICPSCRAIMEGNSFINQGFFDITGFLALIAPVIINEGSITTTGGLILSNLGIDRQAFYNGMAELQKSGINPADSFILNKGEIDAMTGKIIALIGANGGVHNFGSIRAEGGAIALIAGDKVSFPLTKDGVFEVSVEGLTGIKGQVFDAEGTPVETDGVITNSGLLQANGGFVLLSAAAREQMLDKMINITGTVEAKSLQEKDGEIVLSGDEGNVAISGNLNASAAENGARGGKINITGNDIEVLDGAKIEALGYGIDSNGGSIFVMGQGTSTLNAGSLLDASAGTSGDGGFIEFSSKSNVELAGGVMLAEAQDGNAGNILIDPTDLIISTNQFTGGANVTYQADNTLTVNAGVLISSRQVAAGGDHLTANSIGNSGNITFEAQTITIGSGAKILAQGTGSFTGGDVNILATQDAVTVTPLINYNDSHAKITINNATIKGDDVNIIATSTAGRTFSDGDSPIEWGIGLLNVSGGPSSLVGGGIAVAYSDAQVEVNSGSLIEGTNVKLKADAKSDATVLLLGGEGVMVGYGETVTTAKVTVDSATIKAAQDVNIETFANSKTEVNATVANLGTRGQAPLAVTFAGADSTTTSEAVVKGTSNIEAGDDITLKADTRKFQNVNASGGAYTDGVLGIAVAYSESTSTTKASLGGTAKADGDIEVNATMLADKNDVAAASAAGSGLVAGLVVGGLNGAINGVFNKKKPATTKDPQSQPFGLAASLAISDHENFVTSEIADNASVKGKGNLTVNATSSERPETSAIASVDSANMTNDTKKNVAIAAAIVIGDFENNAEARIGTGATVDAYKDLTVHAEALNPYSIQWDQIEGVGDILDKINPNLGVQNGLFTSWAQSSATGEDVGIAGSVNILTLENNAKSYIDTNANVNQDASYRTDQQDVDVTADTSIESLNISGNFGLNPVATGGAKGGIGVGYLEVDYINNTYAGIKSGAKVSGETVEVAADTITKNISIAESGGKGGQYGFNGAFSFQGIDNETVAQIDDGATIASRADTGDGVLVHAKDESKIINVAGGISKAGNVGIGTSVSLNEIDRDTRSRIGNETADLDSTTGSVSSDSNVKAEAENTGLIGSYSLAAAIVMPDAKTPSAGNFGIGISGDVSLNKLRDNTTASIDDADIKKATDVTVTAKAGGEIESVSGAVTINTQSGTSVGLAGSFTNNDIVSNTKAMIDNSVVDSTGNIKVEAMNESSMTSINASGSGASAAGRAIAGSTAYNDITNNTFAYALDSDIKNSKLVTIKAKDDSEIFGVAGSIAGGGKGGSASGAVNNLIKSNIKAYSENSDIKATDKITLDASATGKIEGYAASIGIATSGTGSSGSTSDNEIETIVEAGVKGKKSLGVRSDSDIILKAVNDADIFLAAGNISASGQSGYGRSTGANDIDNETRTYVDGGRLDSKGKIDMKAESTGTLQVITVGGSGTAGNSLAAGVSDNDVNNVIETKIVSDSDVDATGDITMLASDTSTIQALGGVVAGGGNNSVGAVVSLNDVSNQILTTIDDSTVTSTGGKISLDAYSKSSIDALAASGAVGGQAGLSGAVTLNEVDNDVWARVQNGADVDASGKIKIEAYDESTIRSLAGAISVGTNSLGGSVATNDITNEVHAYVDGATVESSGNSVEVKATEKAGIETISVGGAFSGTNSLGGSVSLNDIDNSTKAFVNTTDAAGVTGAVVKGNLDVSFTAEDTSTIQALAGQVGSAGSNAVAGAVATNDISNDTFAYGQNSTITATTGAVGVKSTNTSTINTAAIAGGTAGTASIAGSVAINTIANNTQAYLDGSNTTADDTIVIAAKAKSIISTLGGVLSSGGTAGIGGTVVLNTIANITKAWTGKTGAFNSSIVAKGVDSALISKADGTTGTDTVNGLAVVAESIDDIDTKSATLAVGGTGSIAATATVNLVENDTQAFIQDTSVNSSVTSNSAQSVKVRAYSGSDVDMKGGGLSVGGTAGLGATVDKTTVANTTKAYIKGQNSVKAENGVEVKSTTDEKVNSIIASGGISGTAAVTGSVAVIDVDSTNEAFIENAAVDAKGDIKVLADDDVDVDGIAGSLNIGGVAGAGGSVVVTNIENDTTARITDSKTNATGVTEVNADSTTDVTAYTASGNLGGYAGVGGAVTVNTIATTTKALINEVSGTTEINESSSYAGAGQDVKIIAKDTTKLNSKDGNISGGVGVGIGAAIDVATVRNTVTASIGDNTKVSADRDVLVQASSNKDIDSVTVAAAGGAGMGVAGSVSIINVGSAISGEGSTAAASTSSFTNSAISSTNVGTRAGTSDAANAANAKVTAQGSPSASDEFNTSANVSQSTTASIGSSAVVDAGGDITVDADDITEVDAVAGALSIGGFYGIGGAVILANLKSRTNALVGTSADLSAGDDITIDAKGTVNESIIQTVAGSAGQISLGAAYAKIISDNDVTTSISNNAKIRKADQFQVLAENYSNIQAESYGASIGAGAVGISLAEGNETGTVTAAVGSGVDVADEANGKKVNDVLVQAKAGNYVQGYAVAAAGGIVSGSGSSATAKANANTSATIGSGSDIDAENDITVKSYSRNYADADSLGVAAGGLTVGVALSYAETAPNVTASVADSNSGSGTKLNAKRDVTILADSDENALAYSQSAAGGVISGNGSDSDSRTAPTVKAFLGNNNEVDARDALIKAYSITFSQAQASGVSAGALAVAASLADAVTNAVVQAYTGHSSKVRATRNATVLSTFNLFSDGTYLDNRTQAHSNASAGALVGITGTKSTVSSTVNTGAWISTGSLLKAGSGDAKIQAIAQNDTYANAVGKAGGLLAGGYTGFSSTLNTYAESIIYGTGAVEAGNNALINSQALSDSYSNAEGGAGQNISGALEALFTGNFSASDIPSIATIAGVSGSTTVNNTAVARTETGSSVKAVNDATISTLGDTNIFANSYMSSTGVFVADAIAGTDVFADSDALTTIGGTVEGRNVKILAQNNIDINAKAQADVHADIAAAFGTAVTRVRVGDANDPAEAKVVLTATSSILGTVSVLIQALNFQQSANLMAKAVAKAFGSFTATSSTLADGTAYVNSKIQQDSGSKITTADLSGKVDTNYQMERISEPTADTIVTKVIEVARTVVKEVCTWLPWPLDDLCDLVTEVVFDLVTVIDGSTENSDIGGSGLIVGDNINMNGDLNGIGGQDRLVTVNADGSVTGGSGTIQGNDVLLGDIKNTAVSKFRFTAEKGTITGNAVIHLKKVINATVQNNSLFNLVLGKLDLVSTNGGEPDVVYNSPTTTRYTIDSAVAPVKLEIENNGTGNVVFNEAVRNYLADFTVSNDGGSILAKDNNVLFEVGGAHLRADNGTLGTDAQRLNFRLVRADKLPDGTTNPNPAELDAFSYGDMHLGVTGVNTLISTAACAACTPYTFDPNTVVNNIKLDQINTFGKADILLNKGSLLDYKRISHDNLTTQYDINSITANKDVTLGGTGTILNVTGSIQSGLKDINYTVDGSNVYEHEKSDNGSLVALKDIANGGGKITLTGSLKGNGTLKVLDGYSRFDLANTTSKDVQLGVLNLDARVNKNISLGGDADVTNLEYDQVKVETFGYATSGVNINSTDTNADVTIIGTVGNSTGTATVNAVGSVFQGLNGLIKAKDIIINAGLGVGTASAFVLTDLQGGRLDVLAGGDVFINETVGDMVIGNITTLEDVMLTANGAITDFGDNGFGENLGAESDITARSAVLQAGSGIGTFSDGIETRLTGFGGAAGNGRLEANGGTGGVYVSNKGSNGFGLTVGGIGSLSKGISVTGGNIGIYSNSPLDINSDVEDLGGGDIVLSANGATAADDLTLNANVTASGGNGNVILSAGDTITLNSNKTVTAAGNGNIQLLAGEDFADGTIDRDGNTGANGGQIVLTDGTRVVASNGTLMADAADDIAISSLQTGNNTTSAITVNSRAGKITDGGETHTDLITGTNGQATLRAVEGIGFNGSPNSIETSIGHLDLINSGSGDVYLNETNAGGALGINRAFQQGSGDMLIVTNNGPLTVNAGQFGVSTTSGIAQLMTSGGDLNINDTITTSSGNVSLQALSNSINFSSEGDVTSNSGAFGFIANNDVIMADGAIANAGTGTIGITAGGNIALASLQTANNVNLDAGAAVSDNGDSNINVITGANNLLTISSVSGIGSSNALETSAGHLDATNTASGNINIDEVAAGGNLGINKVNQQSAGSVTVRTLDGTLTVNAGQSGVSAKAGELTLSANGSFSNDDLIVNDTVTTTSGKINLDSTSNDVIFSSEGDVTSTSGEIEVSAARDIALAGGSVHQTASGDLDYDAGRDITMDALAQTTTNSGFAAFDAGRDITQTDTALTSSGTGNVAWNAGRNIAIASIQNTSNSSSAVVLNAGGAVSDNGDTDLDVVTGAGGQLVINASNGIGSGNALETSTGNLDLINNGPNNIEITEVASGGALGINRVDQQGSGTVVVRTDDGALTVNAGQNGVSAKAGEVTLSANGTNRDLTVNDTVTTTSGKINLDSNSRDVLFSSEGDVTSASGEVEIFAVRDVTQADGAIVNAGSGNIDVDAGRNAAVASLQTANNSNDAVNINAGSAVSDNGDTDLDVVTGTNGQLVINAFNGIGSSNALETSVGNLDLTNTASGNINIDEVASGGNLGINKVDQQGAGTVTVRALDGTLTVNAGQSGVQAVSGEVTLSAQGTNNDDDVIVNDTVVTDSGKINIDSLNNDVKFSAEGDVTSNSGKVEVTANRDIIQDDGAIINSGLGNIDLLAGRDIALASLQTISAATDAVLINAVSGEVRDNGDTDSDIVAQNGTTTIRAKTGIGSLNALDTRMANVSAITDSGNVQIDNTGALNVVTANGVSGISITDAQDLNAGEFITVRTFSPLNITAGSPVANHAGGDVTLNALGKLAADDLTLDADVTTDGGNGNVLLTAGDTFTISNGIKVSAAGTGNVTVASGEDFTDGLINQDGNTGVGGGDVIMAGTAQFLTEAGNVTVDAGDDFFVGVINTDSDNDGNIGDAFATTRAGSILDSNGPDMNITADELTLDSAGSIGTSGDPIETTVRVLNALSVGSMFFFNVGSITAKLTSLQGSVGLQATGNIFLAGVYAPNGTVALQSGGSILSSLGGGIAVAANTVITLIANGTIGGASTPVVFNLTNPGNVFVSAVGGSSEGLSVNMTGNVGPSSFEFLNLPPGLILLNGAAVGGGTFSLMASGVSNGLYSAVFPQPTQGSGIIDGRFAADFPGAFNADNFSYNPPQGIDTSALENIEMPVFELPTVVPVPQESAAKTSVVEEEAKEEEKKEEAAQGENPPAVVPVPADAQPSDAEITEPISAENL